ncbi:MAG: hypothetical protein JRI89_15810 [Deltaproteobacteria bacterium]|nr:hypothetical protein [Deltaproteobacteria bacterium]
MKRLAFLMIIFLLFFNHMDITRAQSADMEKVHSDINLALMNANLAKLSALLAKMSDMLANGNLKPRHQKKCAEILFEASSIMTQMTRSNNLTAYKQHQEKIEQLNKEWNYFEEQEEH